VTGVDSQKCSPSRYKEEHDLIKLWISLKKNNRKGTAELGLPSKHAKQENGTSSLNQY